MSGLIVICGPTATGKSIVAIALAQRLSAAILSADSRQVYREFDIGTAKPSRLERQQVPHYLIDICDPTDTLTLATFQHQAQGLIQRFQSGEYSLGGQRLEAATVQLGLPVDCSDSAIARQELASMPLLVGGTGLYIKSIVRGLKIPRVSPQLELRSQLHSLGQTHCYALLRQVDGASAEKIHPHDQVRTLRALEVFYVTGRPISMQQGECPPSYPILQIGLDSLDNERLTQRIAHRTGQMLDSGLVNEVEYLCQVYGADLPLLNTLGYQEIKQYLAADCSLDGAQQLIVQHTRQFAKRQRTWFRSDPTITWFDCDRPDVLDQIWPHVAAFVDAVADRPCQSTIQSSI